MKIVVWIIDKIQRIDLDEICTGIEYISSALKLSVRAAVVSSGAITIAFVAGWFSATDVSIRVSSYILFSWFATLSLIVFAFSFAMEGDYKKSRKAIISRGIFTMVISLLVLTMMIKMVIGAVSLMRLATTQPFRKDLVALDYDAALRDATMDAGYPFGAIIPFSNQRPMFIDVKYLSYSTNTGSLCETPGRPFPTEKTGETIEGTLVPIGGTQIAVIQNETNIVSYIEIFGILDNDTDSKQNNLAASTLIRIAKRISKNGTMKGTCFRPSEQSEKWACSIGHMLHNQELDVATILLENGRAKINPLMLKGSKFENLYIDAQLSAASKGCGIWSKENS